MSEHELSEIFKRDLPQQSDASWADDARRRHGRRRAGIGGVAVVAALAVVSPFALQLLNNDAQTAQPAPTGTPPTDAQTGGDRASACAGAAESAGAELPETAVRLWLCDEPGEIGFSRQGPQEPLTQGVDAALAAFRELDKADPAMACTMEYVLTYLVVAEAADGTLTPVAGELHGCRTIGERVGGDGYLETLGELWAAQRAAEPAPDTEFTVEELCGGSASILPATLESSTQGALCATADPGAGSVDGALMSPDLVTRLRDAVEADAVNGTVGEWEMTARVVLQNPWGDSLTMTRYPSGAFQFGDRVWRPKGELATALDDLFVQTGIPSVDPVPVEPRTCTAEREASAAGPAVIEGDVTGVYVCVENRDGEPRWAWSGSGLYEPEFVDRAVDAFNDLPALEAECEDTARADVFVVYQSMDGIAASVRATSCGPTTGAVKKDGPAFVEAIHGLTREQAGAEGMGMYFAAQELCPQLDSLVRFDPQTEAATQLAACVGPEGQLPIDVGPELVQSVTAELSADPAPEGWEPGGGTLVWVNKYGEPITLIRGVDGSFTWVDVDGAPQHWMPTGEVKDQLDRIFGL